MSVCEEVKKILAQPIGIKQSDGSVFITELSEDTIETRSGQICQLFKLKLPENPYKDSELGSVDFHVWQGQMVNAYDIFNKALEQVKELNKEMVE